MVFGESATINVKGRQEAVKVFQALRHDLSPG
jgi:hypothetical protein